jgi:hypothetical protein
LKSFKHLVCATSTLTIWIPFSNNTSRSVFIDSQLLKKNQEPFRVGLVNFIECLDDPLFAQTKAIWDSFSPSRIRSSQNILLSAEDSRFSDERCLQFFSPPSLKRLIQIFWDEWYPHCPIIHKPTFDILRAPPILLVPMAVMGACLSPISQELKSAKSSWNLEKNLCFHVPSSHWSPLSEKSRKTTFRR